MRRFVDSVRRLCDLNRDGRIYRTTPAVNDFLRKIEPVDGERIAYKRCYMLHFTSIPHADQVALMRDSFGYIPVSESYEFGNETDYTIYQQGELAYPAMRDSKLFTFGNMPNGTISGVFRCLIPADSQTFERKRVPRIRDRATTWKDGNLPSDEVLNPHSCYTITNFNLSESVVLLDRVSLDHARLQ